MSNKCVVTVQTELPPASAEWKVDLGADPEQGLVYGNLAYDLVAAAIAKLGVEYSKYILGTQTPDQFNAEMASVLTSLKAGTVAG